MARRNHGDSGYKYEFSRGLVNGLLIAIPLWTIIGIVLAIVFEYWPLNATAIAALTIAAVCEALLARPYMRALWSRFRRMDSRRDAVGDEAHFEEHALGVCGNLDGSFENLTERRFQSKEDLLPYVTHSLALSLQACRVVVPVSLFRQSLALSALVGAYLQYYFLEVNLQIALMPSLTVFLPVAPMS